MSLPDVKQLKKLAKACRDAGIKHFKSSEFEFTLTDEAPVRFKNNRAVAFHKDDGPVETEGELTPEQLLFYSVNDQVDAVTEGN